MTEAVDERSAAVRAIDTACQHCGAARTPDQQYCVECGHELPAVRGRVPAWRRRWVRRVGWYPGDWIWASLLALPLAVAGAAIAIVVSQQRASTGAHVITALARIPVAEPVVPAATTAAGTLPTPPEPTATTGAASRGNQVWPAGRTGWTIVLVSYPKTAGLSAARKTAARAARAHLPEVGVLDSNSYASLQPGYFVVFSGIYDSQVEANAGVTSAHQAGFGAAYSRQING